VTWSGRPMSRFSRITSSKKRATSHRLVEDLGQRELGLKDRQLVANVPRAVVRRDEMH
jgi:hypothetical protein